MTVKAYLVKKITSKIEDDEMIIEKKLEKTPTFNLNKHENILKIFQENNGDNTNDDLNGELVIDKDTWQKILNGILTEEYTLDELNIIKKITNDLKNKKIIYYECF